MANYVNTVDVIGDEALTDSLIEGSLIEFTDNTITILSASSFRGCDLIEKVILPSVTKILDSAFYGCKNLMTLILPNESTVCTLGYSVLYSTMIANGLGYIYVPAALVDSYKSASNWSTYKDQIRAIEDWPDIAGG